MQIKYTFMPTALQLSQCAATYKVVTSSRRKNGIVGKKEVLFTMATETLGFTTRFKVSITLFILVYIDFLRCQQFVLPFKAPSDCSADEFFDISSLSCVKCGPNQRRSLTGPDPLTAAN